MKTLLICLISLMALGTFGCVTERATDHVGDPDEPDPWGGMEAIDHPDVQLTESQMKALAVAFADIQKQEATMPHSEYQIHLLAHKTYFQIEFVPFGSKEDIIAGRTIGRAANYLVSKKNCKIIKKYYGQ
jgi:hypothetical protein